MREFKNLKPYLNLVAHRRTKLGVSIDLEISSAEPIDPELFDKIASIAEALNELFDAIPDQPAGGLE